MDCFFNKWTTYFLLDRTKLLAGRAIYHLCCVYLRLICNCEKKGLCSSRWDARGASISLGFSEDDKLFIGSLLLTIAVVSLFFEGTNEAIRTSFYRVWYKKTFFYPRNTQKIIESRGTNWKDILNSLQFQSSSVFKLVFLTALISRV